MEGKSILENIKDAIYNIEWQSDTKRNKALELCTSIYNLYIIQGGDFNIYKSLSKGYFISQIKSKSYLYEIKDCLIENLILECSHSYDKKKKKAKGYRFNQSLISGDYVALKGPNNIIKALKGPKSDSDQFFSYLGLSKYNIQVLNHLSLYHICGPKVNDYILKGLQRVTFDEKIYDYINNFELKREDVKINNEIDNEFINVIFDDDKYRYKLETALKQASLMNKDLIQYKDKCYIENVDDFLIRKTNDLRLIFKKSIFDIDNGILRVSRNETNNRLDYNLTNMKSELLDYIKIDNENVVELDIANSQFAIFSYIFDDLDDEFVQSSISGNLYSKVNKDKMFRVAFDKIKKEYDDIRVIFPKTMRVIDDFKSLNGYDMFSNLLQKSESKIMIDYVMNNLIDDGYTIFPIHDSFRIKESDYKDIKNRIEELFNDINFRCLLRNKLKNNKEVVKHKYKGFEDVLIERCIEDKEVFKKSIDYIIKENGGISESLLLSYLPKFGWDKYKIDYYYKNWSDKKNKKLI